MLVFTISENLLCTRIVFIFFQFSQQWLLHKSENWVSDKVQLKALFHIFVVLSALFLLEIGILISVRDDDYEPEGKGTASQKWLQNVLLKMNAHNSVSE